ncbi:uncharacterized protein LOC119744849 [Patiria miniata]|uniref:Uncharacterized protein n=1 Tax=Patiria miniata TaxID=46514 RepID=A0A914BN98_PATMI|nr:uncharacterized protein LOC119744849 [Patiria miniata]
MASSDRPKGVTRDKRVIYKISDSRRHLVGPSRLGSVATLYHPNLPHLPVDPIPAVHSHLPELVEQDTTSGNTTHDSPECAGFVAAGSWGASAPDIDAVEASHHPHLEGNHPILEAIIDDNQPIAERHDSPGFSYGANPSVLDLIPELQRPQSYYYINNASCGPGSSTAIGSSGWIDSFDLGFPSVRTSDQWSGHLKSVLLDVFQPSTDSGFPTILQPRFKKTPGTSAALFVPSVMASIWRQYSEENEPTCPGVTQAAAERPIVIPNNEDYAAPVSGSKTKGIPLNKGKNAKTASLSASKKRASPYGGGASAADQTSGNGGTHNKGQNHDMAGGRLARWQKLLKYVLVGLKQPQPSDHVELQDMSSFSPIDVSPSPTDNPETHPELVEESPHGEVTFFHYTSDGTEYSCTSVPITVPPGPSSHQRGSETGDEMENRVSNTSSDSLVVIESDSEEEDEEEIIEAVLIQELDHGNCACTRFSNHSVEDGCTEEAESSSFINQPLSSEYSTCSRIPNGNINGNCLEKHESDVPKSTMKRRTSSIKRIPKIIRNKKKKVSFAVRSPNHKHGPKILGFLTGSKDDLDSDDKTCHKRTGKQRRGKRETHSTDDDCVDEPFEWPDNYIHVKLPPRWTPPRNDYEADAYISVASRYVPNVYVKLYIQVPPMTHLCELKTHLLICVFRSFFTTTEGLHINWVMSLQSHVYNLLYMDVARVRFRRDSQGRPCRACLLLSQDATTLVRHKRCSLLTTIADILQISPEELLVMENGQRVGLGEAELSVGRKLIPGQL